MGQRRRGNVGVPTVKGAEGGGKGLGGGYVVVGFGETPPADPNPLSSPKSFGRKSELWPTESLRSLRPTPTTVASTG